MARTWKVQVNIARSLVLVVLIAGTLALLTKWPLNRRFTTAASTHSNPSTKAQGPTRLLPRIDSDDESSSDESSSDETSSDTFARCDFVAISKGQYTQNGACKRAYMNGLHLDCILRQPTFTPSKFTSHADLKAYGWVETVKYPIRTKVYHLDNAFQVLGINQDVASWAEFNLGHERDVTSAPDGKSYEASNAQYINHYNPERGVWVASYNYGPDWMFALSEGSSKKPRAVPLKQWSDVAFLAVADFCQKEAAGSLRRLERVFRTNVENGLTLRILRAVVGKASLGDGMGWPGLRLDIGDPRAKAVLGTPNGNGVAWMLAQHKQELGVKYVDYINVFDCWGTGGLWCIHFHIADVPA